MKNTEETIDLEVNLGKELASKITRMTKKELIQTFAVTTLKSNVQAATIKELENEIRNIDRKMIATVKHLEREVSEGQERLLIAQSYVEQSKGMIESITNGWDDYYI